jgi:hypothetical protein
MAIFLTEDIYIMLLPIFFIDSLTTGGKNCETLPPFRKTSRTSVEATEVY